MVVIESLKFENVTLKFGGITALNEISFEVKPKKLYSIIGPNGAGKTSIFNCISGIYRPVSSLLFSKKVKKNEIEARKNADEIIDFLEIEQFRYSYIMSLPYGVQKRVELGRALAMNPDLLLLDEPAAGMNNEETEDIARFIIDIHEEMKKTIIMVDHDMNMIMDIAEEVMVLNFGEKLAEGVPNEIVKDKKVIDAYLGVS